MISQRQDHIEKLGELIKDIQVAMMTTTGGDGSLHSRPMMTQTEEFDGDLWFFTDRQSSKCDEIRHDSRVNLSYADWNRQRYVSVSGRAMLVEDRERMKQMWSPAYKAWFPQGVDDPNLTLLKVEVEGAEYWDSPSSTMVKVVGFVKAIVTGERIKPGENREIDLKGVRT